MAKTNAGIAWDSLIITSMQNDVEKILQEILLEVRR